MPTLHEEDCDLHDLSNRILGALRSPLEARPRLEAICEIVAAFEARCEVRDAAADLLLTVRVLCDTLLKKNRPQLAEEDLEQLTQFAEGLKQRSLRFQTHATAPARADVTNSKPQGEDIQKGALNTRRLIPATILYIDDNLSDLRATGKLFDTWRSYQEIERFDLTLRTFPDSSLGSSGFQAHFAEAEEFENQVRLLVSDRSEDMLSPKQGVGVRRHGRLFQEQMRFLQAVIFDYEIICGSDGRGRSTSGAALAEMLRELRPGVGRYLLTGKRQAFADRFGLFTSVCWKEDLEAGEAEELFFAILRDLRRKYHTPFWDALHGFSQRPVITCHAMALAHGHSARKGASIADFVRFYNLNYFRAEVSATVEPLDSLLDPVGSIRDAQTQAAQAFGANRTLFVTNGTSTANKIVLQTVLSAGDSLLVDRNCHISHHYGIALSRGRPYYMEPYQLPLFALSGGIPLAELDNRVRSAWLVEKQLPKAILVTNCTFDGMMCRPREIISCVRASLRNLPETGGEERLKDIVFIFDEAWFAFARFHPYFVPYTAMAAVAELNAEEPDFYKPRLRVYATQSTHKTLSAFRQGSMIHIVDPVLERPDLYGEASVRLGARLQQAFLTHTSTSPHNGIIASLDVARRQAELEGTNLVGQAIELARELRATLADEQASDPQWRWFHHYFGLLGEDELIPPALRGQFALDPTKLTIAIKADITASEVRHTLIDKYDIQFNKYSHNTVLLMVTIGASRTTIENIKVSLAKYAATLHEQAVPLRAGERAEEDGANTGKGYKYAVVPPFSGFLSDEEGRRPNDLGRFVFNDDHYTVARRRLADCSGGRVVSASFVVPYPPGYPVLIPGQIVSDAMVAFLRQLETDEIHGAERHGTELSLLVYERQQ
jgi:arginine decarboxylase